MKRVPTRQIYIGYIKYQDRIYTLMERVPIQQIYTEMKRVPVERITIE